MQLRVLLKLVPSFCYAPLTFVCDVCCLLCLSLCLPLSLCLWCCLSLSLCLCRCPCVINCRQYFARLGLLHPAVNFLQGFFADTLPGADIDQLALLRADGDTYESTRDVLENMYAKVVPGGFIVIDDYHSFQECREAVDEFREKVGDTAPIQPVDNLSVYWRKA